MSKSWDRSLPVTRNDLVSFIEDLARSIEEIPELWENDSLSSFLQALSASLNDMDGYLLNRHEPVPDKLSWTPFCLTSM
jgi:hypothetical protein